MKRKLIRFLSVILVVATVLAGCTSATQSTTESTTQSTQTGTTTEDSQTITATILSTTSEVVIDTEFTAKDLEVGYEDTTATYIILNDNSIEVSGDGAIAEGTTLTISSEGTYVIQGTLENGQIIIAAGDSDKVQLVLKGVSITCRDHAPIYIKNADKVFITLKDATENTLTDGEEYVQTDDNTVDGVIYSKADLTINGSGSLTITGNYRHGIVSKDDIVITGGNYDITAVKDAINGKDCVKIKDGIFTLSSATGNGIQSKNGDDTTKGYVYISGGDITITECVEGIEGTVIIVLDGIINITALDDGLNAASGSAETTAASDATDALAIEAVPDEVADTTGASAETLSSEDEQGATTAKVITLNSTDTLDTAITETTAIETTAIETNSRVPGAMGPGRADDGTRPENAPTDGMEPGSFGGGEDPFEVDTNCYISISGGTITIDAQGDGIDSNGSIYISGGNIYVNGPTESMNASLDYTGTGEITGGTVLAAGSSGMAQGFSNTSTQYSLLYYLTTVATANTEVKLTDADGNVVVSFTPNKQYQSIVISSPELIQGATYTLTSGDQTAEITLDSVSTSNGQQGMGMRGRLVN